MMPRKQRMTIRRKRGELAAGHQLSELCGPENRMQHVRIAAPRFLNGEIVATETGKGVHTSA